MTTPPYPPQQQGPPAYGHYPAGDIPHGGYSGGPPPPAAAYGAPQGYPGYPGYNNQGFTGAPYAGAGSFGGPYAGMPPPYPPAAPVYTGAPANTSYSYTQQQPPVYGKAVGSTAAGSLEMGTPPTPPSAEEKITDSISVEIRHAFVRKVLGILALQILVTFGVASVFGFVPVLRDFLLRNFWIAIVGAVAAFVLQLVLVCVPNLARKVPANFILMTLITLCYALVLSCAAAASSRNAFLIAIGSTFVVVVGLMIFACQTKYDFTGCGTYLFVAILCLMIFGFLCIFFSNHILHLVYSSIATLLFCMLLVYDTQLVVGGKHRRYQYSVDDYIFAALTLYIDIIIIFMNILAIADN